MLHDTAQPFELSTATLRLDEVSLTITQHDGNAQKWDCDRNIILPSPLKSATTASRGPRPPESNNRTDWKLPFAFPKQHTDIVGIRIWSYEISNTIPVQITQGQTYCTISNQVIAVSDELG